ncbi:MAG: DUF177 domain-containing protein [Candidatus Hatepunaea meridiana]|nr:DUF177 domain-containing protein [Candidatus Hatepunaea meridiana]
MKIRIENLRDGSNHWEETVAPDELELDTNSFKEMVKVELDIEKRSGKITISISVSSNGSYICDRCGEEFSKKISDKYLVVFIKRESPLPEEAPGDDLRSYQPGQRELDITTDVRDAMLLTMPLKMLCKDDCKGLCSKCGANLNYDECICKTG